MLFGVPEVRDARGSGATDPDGILNVATRVAVEASAGRLVVQTDLCLDEFTDHGHCGVLDDRGRVDNDATLERYTAMALEQARAGSELLGLERHDGRPGRRRARGPRRRRAHRHRDPRLLGEVRVRVLRPVPRRGRVDARGRPPLVPARPRQPARGVARGADRHRRGRRHRHGEAGRQLPRRARRRRRGDATCPCGPTRCRASTR